MALRAPKRRRVSPPANGEVAGGKFSRDASTERNATEMTVAQDKLRNGARSRPCSPLSSAYNSGMLQLQIDELISKVRSDYEKRMVRAESALCKLKDIIERIPHRDPKLVLEAEHSLQYPVPFPHPRPGNEAKYTLAYAKPANINVVGSFARRTAIQVSNPLAIDLAVTMPPEIFQDKDYLNHRYFYKRAYYLACIRKGIEEAEDCTFVVESTYQGVNDLQPVIIIKPGQVSDDFAKSQCHIRIILAAGEGLFPISRTLPNKNCVRPRVAGPACQISPTPFYNATLRSECSTLAYLKFLQAASFRFRNFSDACALGSIWIRQRGLRHGGFGAFEWACMMALLLKAGGQRGTPVLSIGHSSYQLFKATLKYIAAKDLVAKPIFIQFDDNATINTQHPVMFDGERGMNVLFKMTPWSYANLKHEASLTLRVLGDPLSSQFDACFTARVDDPLLKFDCAFSIPIPSEHSDPVSAYTMFSQRLYQTLKTGLKDRAVLIQVKPPRDSAWGTETCMQSRKGQNVQVGLLLDPQQVNRIVDRGPPAEDKVSAAAFRRFWGNKAELRRFKDGSIQESLVWSMSDFQGSVLKQIITHVVQRHVGEEAAEGLTIAGQSFDRLVLGERVNAVEPVNLYQPIMKAFEILEKDIRSLKGLPLQIRQVSAADPHLRYASPKPPVLELPQCKKEPVNIYVQFEGSSRWPDDLAAVQRTKIAFLLKISELLDVATTALTARLGLEHTDHKLMNIAYLDILYTSGAFFRMRIDHEREINLLERALKGAPSVAASSEEIALALSSYKGNFIQAPLYTQAVRTLSTRFPVLPSSMRLMKDWRDSHLLSGHISDELIELLTIRTFLHPYPWSVPGSFLTGFLRTLTFISKWDWWYDPLIVDFNGEMNSKDIDAIKLRFEAWRRIDPTLNRVAMFVASNMDRDGITWTGSSPTKVVAARFTSLAKAACRLIQEQGMSLEPGALFAASMGDYDFVIHVNKKLLNDRQRADEGRQPILKNLQVQASKYRGLDDIEPVLSFVKELKVLYGSSILFFHNEQDTSVIAGLWNPQTGPRPWKINLPYSTFPIAPAKGTGDHTEAQISINKAGTLHDIARLGGDLVSRIDVKQ